MKSFLRIIFLFLCAGIVFIAHGDDGYESEGNGGEHGYENEYDGDEYGYSNSYSINGNNYNNNNDGHIHLKNCPNSVVETTSVKLLCDSPYTFYYGNGAHRNSPWCDYGDKATISVSFNVTTTMEYDDQIYVTLAVYAATADYELLYALKAQKLCNNLVSSSCASQGEYSFSKKVQFDDLYGDNSEFNTVVEMGFSTKPDEGANLGGSNIDCWYAEGEYDQWINEDSSKIKTRGTGSVAANYGILLGTLTLLFGFSIHLWRSVGTEVEYKGKMGLLAEEGEQPTISESPRS